MMLHSFCLAQCKGESMMPIYLCCAWLVIFSPAPRHALINFAWLSCFIGISYLLFLFSLQYIRESQEIPCRLHQDVHDADCQRHRASKAHFPDGLALSLPVRNIFQQN